MTELDPEEEAILESARRAFSPPDGVTRKMRAALVARLVAPGVIAASSAAATSGTVASTTAAAASAATAAATGSAAPLVAAGSAVATGAKIAASAALLKVAAGVTTAALLATATSSYWLPDASVPAVAPAVSMTTPAATPDKRTGARAPSSPVTPIPKPDDARTTHVGPAGQQAGRVASPIHGGARQPELQGELDVLRRAQQAIQSGQPSLALELLGKLDAEHPASSLRQEREVARVLALCGVGQVSAAREMAQRILTASPNSLYAGRLQASCAAVPAPPLAPANASVSGSEKSTRAAPPVARFGDSGD